MIALPFIYVDISVQGSGVVRPVTEKTEITSYITELIDSVYVREGDQVNKFCLLYTSIRLQAVYLAHPITGFTCINDDRQVLVV